MRPSGDGPATYETLTTPPYFGIKTCSKNDNRYNFKIIHFIKPLEIFPPIYRRIRKARLSARTAAH